ncbi:MAG: cytochrome c3 family protein [Alphaproteobacteria bacterium]|nr:cytochrome c3 family protein [Alphaproteobacteria bacterium]
MRRHPKLAWTAAGLVATLTLAAGCPPVSEYPGDAEFQRTPHSLLPEAPSPFDTNATPWHLGAGAITGTGPEQPIAFPHYRHVTVAGMQCEYCHAVARKSIHAGVPQTATCMNCHTYVLKDSPEIQKVKGYYDAGEPIPWVKVHDIPDFVNFAHDRHVRAGVDCTECHGQVGLQGQVTNWTEVDDNGERVDKSGVRWPMVRETTMQMGWCLDCHATHPSVDKNYGEKATLRRAELKDCWTCHK